MTATSSWIELRTWHACYELGKFPWDQWIQELQLPLPVYDLSKILDQSAVFDMAVHALHWQGGSDLRPVHVTSHMKHMMRAIDVLGPDQQVYMARALYSHCSRYMIGVPRIADPPTYHIDLLPIIPLACLERLAKATMTPYPAERITMWLERVLKYGYDKPLQLQNKYRSRRSSGRRGRKHSCAQEQKAIADNLLLMCDDALCSIKQLAPMYVPDIQCTILNVGSGTVTLALSVQQRAPSDE